MMMLRRYLVTEEPILKPCASRLDTVPSAAPFEVAERQRVGPREGQLAWNPSVSTVAWSPPSVPRSPASWPRYSVHTRLRSTRLLT